ncbi:hypothetical protein [Pseudonocardia sp. NPDC049635]|uniref:hypothetical protein n=1 Tax=Pseudonocardia sp. NPDC049635 TaxID=3155506 RepID=UPI0033F1AC4B
MNHHTITLTVALDRPISDEQASDIATRWASTLAAELVMTSIARDEPWLRVSASASPDAVDVPSIASTAAAALIEEVTHAGHQVTDWHAIEVLTDDEQRRRAATRGIPPLTDAQAFADLLGVKRQRIYQLLTERRGGKRDDFPLPVIEGYWLTSEAEHFARTRRTQPGPPARSASR